MTDTTCTACYSRPAHNAVICQHCADQLHADLHAIPEVTRDLLVDLTGQARKSGTRAAVRRFGHEQPLPLNLAASRALDQLRHALAAACHSVADGLDVQPPADRIGAMTTWLLRHEASIGLRVDGGDTCRALGAALARARRICDNPPEKIYIGHCVCTDQHGQPTRLYARAGQRLHTCPNPDCGRQWDAAERYEDLQAELADYGLTHRELETLLPAVPRSTLHRWLEGDPGRGQAPKLTPQGTTADGEPVYRYGDVLALEARRRERGRVSA